MSKFLLPRVSRYSLVGITTLIGLAASLYAVRNTPTLGPAVGPQMGGPSAGLLVLLCFANTGFALAMGCPFEWAWQRGAGIGDSKREAEDWGVSGVELASAGGPRLSLQEGSRPS
jgi:hypothetical protein